MGVSALRPRNTDCDADRAGSAQTSAAKQTKELLLLTALACVHSAFSAFAVWPAGINRRPNNRLEAGGANKQPIGPGSRDSRLLRGWENPLKLESANRIERRGRQIASLVHRRDSRHYTCTKHCTEIDRERHRWACTSNPCSGRHGAVKNRVVSCNA